MKKDLLTIKDLTLEDVEYIFELAHHLKAGIGDFEKPLSGKSVGLIFQKPSNRTRLSFEVGIYQLGGNAIYLGPDDIQLGAREPIKDIARVQSRYLDGIVARTFSHKDLTSLVRYAAIPVINGLSDLLHPCQAMGDFFTLKERFGKLSSVTLAYVGDGNNVLHSLMYLAAIVGTDLRYSTPEAYQPNADIVKEAQKMAESTRSSITYYKSPDDAVRNADAVYTDVWASMGHEDEHKKRLEDFHGYQVDGRLFSKAKKEALFMHCLPAHRGEEVEAAVIDGDNSIVIDQAENRLHVQKAVLVVYIGGKKRK